jgi:methyltransferase family protein
VYAPAFRALERAGWHLTRNHFYSPIPDTRTLGAERFGEPSEMAGVAVDDAAMLRLLAELSTAYRTEWEEWPGDEGDPRAYYADNPWYAAVDAAIAWGLLRRSAPSRVVEVGSGVSTRLLAAALVRNAAAVAPPGTLVTIDPHAGAVVRAGIPGLTRLVTTPVQDVALDLFTELGEGDVIFIDSSHVVRAGSDVKHEILEILPRLRPGVLVHFHDVLLPYDYPRDWLTEHWRFWNEQYILQAFLAHNRDFEVVWAAYLMHRRHPERLEAAIPRYGREHSLPGSFWIRRV